MIETPDLTVLVLGSGGREHALALALARDPKVTAVHAAPGNPGIASCSTCHDVDPLDAEAVVALARELDANLVVIGPEAPLVAGIADAVRAAGIAVFGPDAAAAQLEGSKTFAKEIMVAAGVPTGASLTCTTVDEAAAALTRFGAPHVVKDDGLAAGKGVVVTLDYEEALQHASTCRQVVIEEFLDGPEVSLFAITDGTTVLPLQPAQDFKRVGDGDAGPNTGGMGAYTPLPWAPEGLVDEVVQTVIQPTVDELRHRGTPFVGLVYAGLALTSRGVRVIEFNARFGDPETQPLLAQLESPLGQVLYAAATGNLAGHPPLQFAPGFAVAVVLANEGYPGPTITGRELTGADGAEVMHAGTARDADGVLRATGGRVLAVIGRGHSLTAARAAAYERIATIGLDGSHYRRDIAALAAEGAL